MRRGEFFQRAAGFALLLALLAATATIGAAQGSAASLTIHNRICPNEYSGDDIFGDCHGNPPPSSLEFFIGGPVSDAGATDADGNVSFTGLPAGPYEISGGVPAELAGSYVYCSANDDPFNVIPVTPTASGISIDIPDGAAVLCDWYNIPYEQSGNDDGDGDGEVPPAEPPPAEEPVPLVPILAAAYLCDVDPGESDPAAVCAPAQGVTVEVTQNDQPLESLTTDTGGAAAIEVEEGATVVLAEEMGSVPPGYLPLSGGVRTIESAAGGERAVFVHVSIGGENGGRLQIVNGSCPTSREARTEVNVIGPLTSSGASSVPCLPANGAPFTITGVGLPGGVIVVSTGADGAWRGALPAGSYAVTDDSGVSASVELVAEATTVVTVVDYVPAPGGTLIVTKIRCPDGGEEEGTTITIDDAPAGAGPGCAPHDGEFRLAEVSDGTSVAVEEFTLGADGAAELTLRTGDYLLTDLVSMQTVTVTIGDGTVTAVNLRQVVFTG